MSGLKSVPLRNREKDDRADLRRWTTRAAQLRITLFARHRGQHDSVYRVEEQVIRFWGQARPWAQSAPP
jgi:hypothetical protein